jgi:nicotinate (nicotinamide) nucleotide adenylyltransferase
MAARRRTSTQAPITPLRVPRGTKMVIVFGGSFDPITSYHGWVSSMVSHYARIPSAHVVYVPAAKNPLKPRGTVASDQDRIAMMRANHRLSLNDEDPGIAGTIWTDEIDRAVWQRARGLERPSYTIDTVRRLRSILPPRVTIRLLVGSDQAVQFGEWKQHRTLLRVAEPWVMLRPPHRTVALFVEAIAEGGGGVREQLAWAKRVLPADVMETSSTQVRRALPKLPLDVARWKNWPYTLNLSEDVAKYIIEHRLYGVGKKFRRTSPGRKPRVAGR